MLPKDATEWSILELCLKFCVKHLVLHIDATLLLLDDCNKSHELWIRLISLKTFEEVSSSTNVNTSSVLVFNLADGTHFVDDIDILGDSS